jgi:preprotein translocase subunit SecG
MHISIISLHLVVCLLLIVMILIQRGRGGGLVEGFSDFESMFGPKTNTLLARVTAVLAVLFLFSCLTLAFLSAQQSKSVFEKFKPPSSQQLPAKGEDNASTSPTPLEGEKKTEEK